MGINATVESFKQKVIKDINESGLPVCLVDYVMTEIANTVKMEYLAAVQKENGLVEKLSQPLTAEETGRVETKGKSFEVLKGKKEA